VRIGDCDDEKAGERLVDEEWFWGECATRFGQSWYGEAAIQRRGLGAMMVEKAPNATSHQDICIRKAQFAIGTATLSATFLETLDRLSRYRDAEFLVEHS